MQQQYIQQPGYQRPDNQQPGYQQPYYQQSNYQQPYYQPRQYAYAPVTPFKKNKKRTLVITGIVVIGAILLLFSVVWLFNQLGDPVSIGPPPEAYWIGLWRYEEETAIMLFHAKPNGTFKVDIYNTKDDLHDTIEGRYEVSEDLSFIASDITNNSAAHPDGFSAFFNVDNHTVLIDGKIFNRVPSENEEAVLDDPTAPYPPGT